MRFLYLTILLATPLLAADQPSSAELKLRETLRNTMLQLRTLQAEKDNLQVERDTLEAEKKEVQAKLDELTKTSASNQAAAEKVIAETQQKLTAREADNRQLSTSLDKWKAAHKEVTAVAEKREAARAKLFSEKVELTRINEDQKRKNLEMFRIGSEILTRYENFGLGTALTAREPFVGTTRVKLQNLVQDYGDKLAEQRIKPEPKATPKP